MNYHDLDPATYGNTESCEGGSHPKKQTPTPNTNLSIVNLDFETQNSFKEK